MWEEVGGQREGFRRGLALDLPLDDPLHGNGDNLLHDLLHGHGNRDHLHDGNLALNLHRLRKKREGAGAQKRQRDSQNIDFSIPSTRQLRCTKADQSLREKRSDLTLKRRGQ